MPGNRWLVAWEDEKGRRYWEMVNKRAQRDELLSIQETKDGAEIALEYVAEITQTMLCSSLKAKARKSNPDDSMWKVSKPKT